MYELNATEDFELHSGAQEGVVDSPEESQTGGDAALDDRDGAVDRQEEGEFEEDFSVGEDDAEEDDAAPDGADREEERKQTREDNAAIRAARLRAEREAEARAEARAAARADEEIKASGVINPYTGKPFESIEEFRNYGRRVQEAKLAELAKKTGKSVEALKEEEEDRALLARLRKAEAKKAAEEASAAERRSFIEKDLLHFVEKYPEFSTPEKIAALENNKTFRAFCGSRFGREPLAELYESYVSVVGAAGGAAVTKAAGKASRSTGSGSRGSEALTPEQKRSLDRWNEENPDMQMTAKEFLSR